MSELTVRRCGVCGKATRPPGTRLADYPGTVGEETIGTCRTCWRKARDMRPPMLCAACGVEYRHAQASPSSYPPGTPTGRDGKCTPCRRSSAFGPACISCDALIRPKRSNPADYPLGAVIGCAGKCNGCYRRDYEAWQVEVDAAWAAEVLAPNPLMRAAITAVESTPNPYTCPCGYRVITHTTTEASRYHTLAARRHKHECGGAA